MLFLGYFFGLFSIGSIGGVIWYKISKDNLRAAICFCGTVVMLMLFLIFINADAMARGFDGLSDLNSARASGYSDPNLWSAAKKSQASQQRLDDALEAATKAGRLILIGALKNPWSASIQADPAHIVSGHVVVCGTVNAKNSFDVYTGAKAFVVHVDTQSLAIEGSDGAENVNWRADCGFPL